MKKRQRAYLVVILALLITTCSKSEAQKLAEAAVRGEASYKVYKTGDYATAKAALLYYIDFNKQLIASGSTEERTYSADIMISYVRLAKLEERNGGSDKEKYMADATSYCQQAKFKAADCSAESMRKAVDVLDQVPVK